MTTSQFASRLDVAQPRVIELEQYEISGGITLKTLERAAEALGCRVVYALIPERPLADVVSERAKLIADKKLKSVDQTMRLENQAAPAKKHQADMQRKVIEQLMRRPARLWDEP